MLSLLKEKYFQNIKIYRLKKLNQNIVEMGLKHQMQIKFLKAHTKNKLIENEKK